MNPKNALVKYPVANQNTEESAFRLTLTCDHSIMLFVLSFPHICWYLFYLTVGHQKQRQQPKVHTLFSLVQHTCPCHIFKFSESKGKKNATNSTNESNWLD